MIRQKEDILDAPEKLFELDRVGWKLIYSEIEGKAALVFTANLILFVYSNVAGLSFVSVINSSENTQH